MTRQTEMRQTETIESAAGIEQLAMRWGFLPFFRCSIPGFSIEEHTAPGYWFSAETDGPWEWKGPVIREGHCAYGKFFRQKAGYVSLEWLPHLLNYRRSLQYAKDDDKAALDDLVLQTIGSEGSATVKELRQLLGLSRRLRHREASELVDNLPLTEKISLEPILTRLMMGLHVVIADFEYNTDRHGRTYGWGVARYTTPEALYGKQHAGCTPEESRRRIVQHLRRLLPQASEKQIQAFVG